LKVLFFGVATKTTDAIGRPHHIFLLVGIPAIVLAFWPSLQLAIAKVRKVAVDLTRAVNETDPLDSKEWHAKVVQPTRALHEVLQLVSSVWGAGMGAITWALWLFALGFFCWVINDAHMQGMTLACGYNPQFQFGGMCVVLLTIPILLSRNLAAASS